LAYADRKPKIHHEARDGSPALPAAIHHELRDGSKDLASALGIASAPRGFSARLSWTHYRVLTKVENAAARLFYEVEADREGWSTTVLERQIHTQLFARLLKSRDKAGVLALATRGLALQRPLDALRDPYVLDFLDLPDAERLHETDLEAAIIDKLQHFLLELGKGFAFFARQKRLEYDDECFYVDLVFDNCILKCFLLIDLKMGRLTHEDVGQMDSYVRLFDDRYTTEGDNPTIGLILCAEKNEAVARYSVLHKSKQLFAARYVTYLPTVEELERELLRERQLLEGRRVRERKAR
jgi:predicted nuclease of restriction endonuclease-like (RecB) superfamily